LATSRQYGDALLGVRHQEEEGNQAAKPPNESASSGSDRLWKVSWPFMAM